jgi:hypothetical protein
MKLRFAIFGLGILSFCCVSANAQDPQPANPATEPAPASGYVVGNPATRPIPPAGSAQPAESATLDTIGTNYTSNAGCCSSGCDASGCRSSGCDSTGCRLSRGCCDSGCCSSRFCFGQGLGQGLPGFLQPSDDCFDGFISPISNPVFFEDPRNLTEARFVYLNHGVPGALGGGDVQLFALQLRARLSDNVSLIATKDGYGTSTNPLLNDGWADISAGLKFNLLRDVANQQLLSGGFTFEFPSGSPQFQQGNGDGELNLFLSGARRFACRNYWISTPGFRLPMDGDDESTVFYWSNHFSHQLNSRWYVLTEFNWFNWMSGGAGGVPGVEGLDIFNFGSTGVVGNDIVTQAIGLKYKPNRCNEIGLAYEFPLTQRRDILEDRVNFNWIFRY